MINRIIHFSVYRRSVVLALSGLLVLAGLIAFQNLPIDAVPDITNNQVQINTTLEGLAPEEIERTVTFPVESSMRGVPGVTQVRSITRFGLSQVTVVFSDEVPLYRARQSISERLQGILSQLPSSAHPQLGPISTGLGEIYQYALDFEKPEVDEDLRVRQLMDLRVLQEWTLKPQLLTVTGVAEVNTNGGYEKQYHVEPDPMALKRYGVHFDDILESLKAVNRNVGGGYIQQSAEQFLVQGVGLFSSIDDIRQVPIKSLETFRTVRVGDVAKVGLGKELRTGAATYNGQETVLGTVMMLIGENSRTVSERVSKKIEEIQGSLPKGVILKPVYNRAELVNATLGTVKHNLLVGATLVIVILLLLVGNVRAALITAVTIPLSLLFAFLVMKPLKISGNLMSLGALDFGIIVDGTVIVMDHCIRVIQERGKSLGRKLTKTEVQAAIYDAAVEIRTAAGFGELIIAVVFLPIFALVGIEGKMFHPMAATFVIALVGALILSFTTAPALASLILSGNTQDKEPWVMRKIHALYEPVLHAALRFRMLVIAGGVVSIVLGVGLFLRLGGEFLPQLQEGSFAFHMIRPPSSSTDISVDLQKKADELVLTFPQVSHVFSRLGTGEVATDPMGINVSDSYIMLKPKDTWPKDSSGHTLTYAELATDIVKKLENHIGGQRYLASQPIQMRFNELLEGTRADVAIKVFGPDLAKNMELSKHIQEIVEKVHGAEDVELDLAGMSSVLRVKPKMESLASLGLSSQEVLDTVSIAIGGEEVGSFYEEGRRSPILVRLGDAHRKDLRTLEDLPVGMGVNITSPLKSIANLDFEETFGSITRENAERRSAVLVNLRGRDTESFVQEAKQKVQSSVSIPQGYRVEWGGNFKNLQEARKRLSIVTPLALLLVLMMIYAAFKNMGQTLLIFSCVPLALVGGVLGLVLMKLPFSISAGVGFIALAGIAVLNGVVLVNCFNQLQEKGIRGTALIHQGTQLRLRPVLMTALVDIFGFLPMLLSTGMGAEVQKPLAAVVIGGILSSTFLTLLVLPALYAKFESNFRSKEAHA